MLINFDVTSLSKEARMALFNDVHDTLYVTDKMKARIEGRDVYSFTGKMRPFKDITPFLHYDGCALDNDVPMTFKDNYLLTDIYDRHTSASLECPERITAMKKIKPLLYQHSRLSQEMLRRVLSDEELAVLRVWDVMYVGDEQGKRYYATPDQIQMERQMLEGVRRREGGPVVSKDVIARYETHLSDEQKNALHHIMKQEPISLVEGMAGTGKSTMMKAAKHCWDDMGYTTIGCALAGKAAAGLQEGANIPSSTLQSLLLRLDKQTATLTDKTIIVIDEAGMLSSRLLADILAKADAANSKVVMLGDDRQLQAIEAGGPFRLLKEELGCARLTTIFRQFDEGARHAVHAFADGRSADGLAYYAQQGWLHRCATTQDTMDALLRDWDQSRDADCRNDFIFAGTNDDVKRLNDGARQYRVQAGDVDSGVIIDGQRGPMEVARNERIMFLKNNTAFNVKNGQLGSVLSVHEHIMCVEKDDGDIVTIDTREYSDFDYGYAMTTHKSQGVTVQRTYTMPSITMDRESAYVANSRFRESNHVYVSREIFPTDKHLIRAMNRSNVKGTTVDASLRVYDHHYWIQALTSIDTLKDIRFYDSDITQAIRSQPESLHQQHVWDTVADTLIERDQYQEALAYLRHIKPEAITLKPIPAPVIEKSTMEYSF